MNRLGPLAWARQAVAAATAGLLLAVAPSSPAGAAASLPMRSIQMRFAEVLPPTERAGSRQAG